jgi:hypothetical protein
MSRDQWARRAALLFFVTSCGSSLSVGCAEEPGGTGGRGGRSGSSGRGGSPDGSSFGGTTGGGSSGVGGFGGSLAGSSGNAGTATGGTAGDMGTGGTNGATGSAGTGGNDAGTDASTNGASGTSGTAGTGGTGGTGGSAGTGGNDAGVDASTDGASGTSGTAGTGGTGGNDAGADASTDGASGTSGSAGTGGTGGTGGVDAGTGGTSGTNGASGTSGTGGTGGTGGNNCNGAPNTAPGFVNLAPPMGAPLDPAAGNTLSPPPPAGWTWYQLQGAVCRDGSPAGIFVRFTTSDKLFVYLEGGGACTNLGFCNFNPANVNRAISGDGQTVLGSTLGVVDARQQPGVFEGGQIRGIFDNSNTSNPFRNWNAVYIPYCTGDVFSGTKTNATVPGVSAPQQFVGHLNMRAFIGRIVPTFKDKVNRVVITGASAGSFGAALNYSMMQDAFGCVKVDALLDSGVPFSDAYMPVCMQQRWRSAWGLNAALPPDCTECQQSDGGGFIKYADFLIRKHPRATLAVISSMQDEVIRLFFSAGVKNCANYDTADPVAITIGQVLDPTIFFSAADYTAGLNDLRTRYQSSGRFATYYLGGPNIPFHQHIWRARFFEAPSGGKTIAAFTTNFLNGTMEQIGP